MWSQDIIDVLKTLQKNSISFSKSHKNNYFYYKKLGDYFRLPTIVLSSFASVISVGLKSDIFKVIRLDPENRPENANQTLDDFYNRYITLFNDSNLIKNIKDEILTIEKNKNMPSSATTISSNASATSSDNSPRVLNQIFTENI